MSIPIAPPPAQAPASSQATTALIVGIVGIVCCQLTAPFAWYLGNKELQQIAAGLSPVAGQGLAQAGKILGIIGSILLILGLVWFFFMGGMVMLSALRARS
ncbi:MAG TPA: DUF4190 domain-containing protein [Thermoanaerobaculia bacterium]|jgi:hypothetical protein|nr:DUF4190 domain-containing protein [Thermoanaerobaculia bacterium]